MADKKCPKCGAYPLLKCTTTYICLNGDCDTVFDLDMNELDREETLCKLFKMTK